MKAVKLLACCALVIPLVGTVPIPSQKSATKAVSSGQMQSRREAVLAIMRQGAALFSAGRYLDSLHTFERMRDAARAEHFDNLAARAAGNIGGCQFALNQYQAALQSFLDAVHAAERAGDFSAAAIFNGNIASLYSEMGQLDDAAEWIAASLKHLSDEDREAHQAHLLIQLASLRARQHRMPEALGLFARGLDAADRRGDLELYANGWNRLGEEYLKQHKLAEAEPALLEAYRIRLLNRLALDSSYRSLGLLRMEQGDNKSAGVLLDRAVDLASRPHGPLPSWEVYHQRGRLRMAQGRLRDALRDLRIAVRLARGWRWNGLRDDAARIGEENWLDKVHGALVEAGNRLYQESGDPALIRETFETLEENRADSLRALVQRSSTPLSGFPPAYWEAMARLQRAEVQAVRDSSQQSIDAAARCRAELKRMELELPGAAMIPPAGLLNRTRDALEGDSALLSFQTGKSVSWLWALDRQGLTLHRLPARKEIEALVKSASESLRGSSSDAAVPSRALYHSLFGSLGEGIKRKTRWLVVLDEGLFEVPLATLRVNGRYLVERHAIETIPGVALWLQAGRSTPLHRAGPFLGVGDAIYNTADPRLGGLFAKRTATLLLPRLVGSAAEVESCARIWGGDEILLEGREASQENLRRGLGRHPAVIHLATHFVDSAGPRPEGLIALSLTPVHEIQLLGGQEIARWRTAADLVVLSGCHSAGAPALPGTGLLGLTRAWLAAGAHTVIATNWAVPDDDGTLFHALYRNLRSGRETTPATALRAAQLEMIRSGDWRSTPHYWGAYFAVGTR